VPINWPSKWAGTRVMAERSKSLNELRAQIAKAWRLASIADPTTATRLKEYADDLEKAARDAERDPPGE
jgi:hypothetical protein